MSLVKQTIKYLVRHRVIEIASLIGLFATLWILHGTLVATQDAAEAAKLSAEAATRNLEITHAASLSITILGPQCLKPGKNSFEFDIHNLGDIDATHFTPINLGIMPAERSSCRNCLDPNCVSWDLITPFETPRFCRAPYEESRRWLIVHSMRLAKATGEKTTWSIATRKLAPEEVDKVDLTLDDSQRLMIIVYGVFRYWNGFRCRVVSACGQYVPRGCRKEGAICGEKLIPLRNCEYPVTLEEEQQPEQCDQPGPTPTKKPWYRRLIQPPKPRPTPGIIVIEGPQLVPPMPQPLRLMSPTATFQQSFLEQKQTDAADLSPP